MRIKQKSLETIEKDYENVIEVCEQLSAHTLVERLQKKKESLKEPLKLMIVGEGKSGKSSLINALTGKEIAKIDDFPQTWCIDVYLHTDGEPYVEFIYEDRKDTLSLKDARSKIDAASDSVPEWKTDLEEIRWHLNLDWPMQGIELIDTPGFDQLREDTEYEPISLYGAEGIQYRAREGFQQYYYKADLVIWCFRAKNVGASVVSDKLKEVQGQNKRIIGIITRLDEIDEDKQSKQFEACRAYYKKYLENDCPAIPSRLPEIYEDDSEREIERKRKLRHHTIAGIKLVINKILEENLRSIKVLEAERFLQNMKQVVGNISGSICRTYYENYQLYMESEQKMNRLMNQEIERSNTELDWQLQDALEECISVGRLNYLWNQCGGVREAFVLAVNQGIEEHNLTEKFHQLMNRVNQRINQETSDLIRQMEWKQVLIDMETGESQTKDNKRKIQIPKLCLKIDAIQVKSTASIMDSVQKLVNEILPGGAVAQYISEKRRDKEIRQVRIQYRQELANLKNEIVHNIEQSIEKAKTSINQVRNETFYQAMGMEQSKIPEKIYAFERQVSQSDWIDSNHKLRWYVDEEDCLGQIVDGYSIQLGWVNHDPRRIAMKFEECYLHQWKSELMAKVRKMVENQKRKYNATQKIHIDEIQFMIPVEEDFRKNGVLRKQLPHLDQIQYEKEFIYIQEQYQKTIEEIRGLIQDELKHLKEECDHYLEKRMDDWIRSMNELPYQKFYQIWSSQLEQTMNVLLARKQYQMLPAEREFDQFFYCMQQYLGMNYQELEAIAEVMDYYKNGKQWSRRYQHISLVNYTGDSCEDMFKLRINQAMNRFVNQLEERKREILKRWDQSLRQDIATYSDQIFEQLIEPTMRQIEETILPEWKAYVTREVEHGNQKYYNFLKYLKSCGKVDKRMIELIMGNEKAIPIGNFLRCYWSDGRYVKASDFVELIARTKKRWERKRV